MIDILTRLLPGLWLSLTLTLASVVVGIPLGFLAGMALTNSRRWLRWTVIVPMEVLRGFPALVTLYLVYVGLAQVITLDAFTAVTVAFAATSAAYTAEIFRAAIQSVPRGQLEAARALAIPRTAQIRQIVAPHVIAISAPPVLGIVLIVFQGTALAYAVGAKELLGTAMSQGLLTYAPMPDLLAASVLYLLVSIGLTGLENWAARRAKRRTAAGGRRPKLARTAQAAL